MNMKKRLTTGKGVADRIISEEEKCPLASNLTVFFFFLKF